MMKTNISSHHLPDNIKETAFWIPNELRMPDIGDFYFVLIKDRDSIIKDIVESTSKRNVAPGQSVWDKLDGRKYSEEAEIIYWLQTHL